jgi:hypothetical protein
LDPVHYSRAFGDPQQKGRNTSQLAESLWSALKKEHMEKMPITKMYISFLEYTNKNFIKER